MSNVKTVGVVGTGVTGASWTALFLANGLQVLVSDPAPDAEKTLAARLQTFWPTLKEIGLKPGASLDNYRFVGASLEKYYDKVDFVQENAPERLDLKTKLLAEIDSGTRPDVVIASSSSGIPSSQFITNCKKNPERVLIGRPFNPPHIMPLVEVVPHPNTSQTAVATALNFYSSAGKSPIHVKQETPGFAANRLQAAVVNEAYSLVARGILSATDVDACMTTSIRPRWALIGPFMTNVTAGGGGMGGFRHTVGHLVPAMEGWLQDMNAHQVEYNDATFAKLEDSVQKELEEFDSKVVEQQRDELLVRLLKDKRGASMIV